MKFLRAAAVFLFFILLSVGEAQEHKSYSVKNRDGKTAEVSVTGVSPSALYVEANGGRDVELKWDILDLEWLKENAKELLDAREYSRQLAVKKEEADKILEKLKREKNPVAITGRVSEISNTGGVLIRARGIPPKGDLARAMTSRTKVASGLCYVENIPDVGDLEPEQYFEIIAYENGEFNYRPSFWENNKTIVKYFARDDRRVSIFDRERPGFVALEDFFKSRENKKRSVGIVEYKPISTGSGYMVKGGYVITAFHVVDGSKRIFVDFEGTFYEAKVAASSKPLDVAILKVLKIDGGVPLYISNNPRIGEEVFSLGYPNTQLQGSSIKYTSGDISSLSGMRDDENFMQISVPLQPGNSGGPLFDLRGNFLGIVVSRLSDSYSLRQSGYVPQNVNYASKAKNLSQLFKELKIEPLEPKTQDMKKADIIEQVQKYCVFIKCER